MRTQRGFTLVEMIVVMAVMMTLMAMLLPAVALHQKKTDLYATANVIQAVHDIQMRCARQFGSAGLVYGYTVRGDRTGIDPWVRGLDGVVAAVDKGDIGRQMFWKNATTIEFVDLVEPKAAASLTVSFEPRTGLPYVGTAAKTLAEVTDPTALPDLVAFDLRSKRSPYPTVYEITISRTGSIDVHGKR